MKIQRNHCLGKSEARKRVADIAATLGSKYGLRSSWDGDDLMIEGSGVSGRIVVAEQSVDVHVKLEFPLTMMASTIQTSVEEAMEKHLIR